MNLNRILVHTYGLGLGATRGIELSLNNHWGSSTLYTFIAPSGNGVGTGLLTYGVEKKKDSLQRGRLLRSYGFMTHSQLTSPVRRSFKNDARPVGALWQVSG